MMLNPRTVTFGGAAWAGVANVTIERSTARLIEEWSDTGPHAVLVDAPEVRTVIKVEQSLSGDDPGGLLPGEAGELIAELGPSGGDLLRRRLRAQAVVVQVAHTITENGARRVITLRAQSSDGVTDPVVVEAVV